MEGKLRWLPVETIDDPALTPAEIEPAARACRVERVIRPYLEALKA